MGEQEGTADASFCTHESHYKEISRIHDVMILENVPEYAVDIPRSRLDARWKLLSAVIDPRIFGFPCARARVYILAYNQKTVRMREGLFSSCNGLQCVWGVILQNL